MGFLATSELSGGGNVSVTFLLLWLKWVYLGLWFQIVREVWQQPDEAGNWETTSSTTKQREQSGSGLSYEATYQQKCTPPASMIHIRSPWPPQTATECPNTWAYGHFSFKPPQWMSRESCLSLHDWWIWDQQGESHGMCSLCKWESLFFRVDPETPGGLWANFCIVLVISASHHLCLSLPVGTKGTMILVHRQRECLLSSQDTDRAISPKKLLIKCLVDCSSSKAVGLSC